MKKQLITAFSLLLVANIFAQVPQAFKYQAVARNANGELLVNQQISIRISIIDSASGGASVYSEIHKEGTNQFGLFSINIGEGITSDVFSNIPWSTGDKWIKIELDPAGGNNHIHIGTHQLLSVPYALYSGNGGGADQTLSLNGNNLSISGGNSIDLTSFLDNTDNQTLSLNGNTLSISGGNSVSLLTGNSWQLIGNSSTNPSVNFIGTTDATDLIVRTNDTLRMKVLSSGNVEVGINPYSNQARLTIVQPGFSTAGWALFSDSLTCCGHMYAKQNANNDYTLGIGTEGNSVLRINPGYGNPALGDSSKTIFESGFPNIPTFVEIYGSAYVTDGIILRAPNGTDCYKVTVNNSGTLVTTSVTCP